MTVAPPVPSVTTKMTPYTVLWKAKPPQLTTWSTGKGLESGLDEAAERD